MGFLGHIFSGKVIEVDPKKTNVVKSWPRPLNPSIIRSFLGLAGYYRRIGLGCVLMQNGKVITYASSEKNYPTHDLNLAVVCLLSRFGAITYTMFLEGNVVADALSRLLIGSVSHINDDKKELGATKMYCDLWEIYWWNRMKKDIAEIMAKSPNYQQVKVEHKKPRGLSQDISIPSWK
ncbi:hypothetical protein MTR67_034965, partial [Solanum verrucosum]